MDEAAEKVGMDPVEFRIKNCLRYGDSCYERWQLLAGKNPRYGIVGPDVNMPEVITKVAERAGWREKWRGWQIPVEINKSKRRGIGVAMGVHHCEYKQYSAVVKMNHDGTASVLTGSVDMGQGCYTVIAQVVAEALGLNYSDVSVNPSDSDSSPAGFGNAGSSGVSSAVNAARHAAEDARRKLIEISAGALRVTPDELKIEKGKIFVTAHPEKAITIADACRRGFQVLGFGLLPSPDLLKDEKTGEVVNGLSIAAVIAEVEVDTDTGELNLIRLWSANDCGCALNPTLVENQVDLGIVMGNGWIRSEDFIIDQSNGVLLNPDLLEYKVMSHLDLPKKEAIDVTIVENPTSWGPYGAKGFSETAMVAVAPAITNAVYNAIGVRMRGPHLTPQKILEALGK
jgi:xanthine dehydrogenase molybdenum-binding subunit